MSVQCPNPDLFEYVRNGIETAVYRSQCDEFYAENIRQHFKNKDTETESLRLVRSWCDLNERSYCAAYSHHKDTSYDNMKSWISKNGKNFELCPFQLLKFLFFISYNIKLDTITSKGGEVTKQELDDYSLLKKWQEQLMYAIISQDERYKYAGWSDLEKIKAS